VAPGDTGERVACLDDVVAGRRRGRCGGRRRGAVRVLVELPLVGNVAPAGITRVSPGWMMLFISSEFARSSADNLIW